MTVFTETSDYDDPAVHAMADSSQLAASPDFWKADVHIFEFGIFYDLFDYIFLIPPSRNVTVVYHNITPPDLAPDTSLRVVLERSLIQKHNLFLADHVVCDRGRRDDLVAFGIPSERLSVLHLPASTHKCTVRRHGMSSGCYSLVAWSHPKASSTSSKR